MELLIFIIAFFLLQNSITKKNPRLKGKINGILIVPIIVLFFCYNLFDSATSLIDGVTEKYVMDGWLWNGNESFALLDEHAGTIAGAIFLGILALAITIIGLAVITKSLQNEKCKKELVCILSYASLIVLTIGVICYRTMLSPVSDYLRNNSTESPMIQSFDNSIISWIIIISLGGMIYTFNRSYGDLCELFENEQKTE